MKYLSYDLSTLPRHLFVAAPLFLTAATWLSACSGGSSGNESSHTLLENSTPTDAESTHVNGPSGTDNTTDSLLESGVQSALNAERWSDPLTWNGDKPLQGAMVTIPSGKHIILDEDVDISSLLVYGTLECGEQDLALNAESIMVHGEFVCGSREEPFTHQFDITLTGQQVDESMMDMPAGMHSHSSMNMGNKVLAAMGGGRISLHGEPRSNWVMLDATTLPGATTLQISTPTDWRAGDRIVITSTSDDMDEAEVRTITSIDNLEITLDAPLEYRHFGEQQVFSNDEQTWTLDTRAEVALLNRNIRIQGDTDSEQSRFGGHIMIMADSIGLLSDVEMNRMGQEGLLGRYPFHWHLAGDVSGQYIRNSSILNSFNRCITVHASHNALIQGNVCMEHIGHGFFLEDGVETGNVFDANLGLLTRKPDPAVALTPSDIQVGEASRGPATFWISNGNNTFTRNTAAGSEGLGFWYDTPERPTGEAASLARYEGVEPIFSPFGEFSNNRVHSSMMSFSSCSNRSGETGYSPPETAILQSLTVFSGGDGAVWPCEGDQVFDNLMLSDSGHLLAASFVSPRPTLIKNSLFVANSALSADGVGRQRTALGLYDWGGELRDVHFVNFNDDYGPSYVFGARDAAVRYTSARVQGVTFDDSYNLYDLRKPVNEVEPSQWGAVVHDLDGSFGFAPGTALVSDHPMMTDDTCSPNYYGEGRLCQNRYGYLSMGFPIRENLPPLTHLRSDGREATFQPLGARARYQGIVSVSHNRYYYGFRYDPILMADGSLRIIMRFLHEGDTVVLELHDVPANVNVPNEGYHEAPSLNALMSGPGDQYFHNGDSLFVKMLARGDDWVAGDRLDLTW